MQLEKKLREEKSYPQEPRDGCGSREVSQVAHVANYTRNIRRFQEHHWRFVQKHTRFLYKVKLIIQRWPGKTGWEPWQRQLWEALTGGEWVGNPICVLCEEETKTKQQRISWKYIRPGELEKREWEIQSDRQVMPRWQDLNARRSTRQECSGSRRNTTHISAILFSLLMNMIAKSAGPEWRRPKTKFGHCQPSIRALMEDLTY